MYTIFKKIIKNEKLKTNAKLKKYDNRLSKKIYIIKTDMKTVSKNKYDCSLKKYTEMK